VGLAAELTLGGFISYDVQVGPGQPISSSGLFEYFWFGSLPIAAYAVWRLSVPLVSRVRLANGFGAVAAGALAMAALTLFLGRQVLSWDSTAA
jgi:hypothetical protein